MLSVAYFEPTPNPNAFKFHTGTPLTSNGKSLSFSDADSANRLPLAEGLFSLGTVEAVLIAEDFISVSGVRTANWPEIKAQVERGLESYDVAQATELADLMQQENHDSKAAAAEDPVYQQVNELFESYVRPALAGDGGGIDLVAVTAGEVQVRYMGACGSCPTSTASTLSAIENLIHDKIDPNLRVVPV